MNKVVKRVIFAVVDIILILILIFVGLQIYIGIRYERIYVIGESMSPTLTGALSENKSGGDYLYADDKKTPARGDIVAVKTPSLLIIKRVIAVGGDTVELKEGELILNGETVDEPYVKYCTPEKMCNTFESHTVEEGMLFVLGDNRDNSDDSRGSYGDVKASDVVGVVCGWSMTYKQFLTGWNTFFCFTVKGKG